MNSFKHRPLAGLLSLKEISNADIVDAFNCAEEKIQPSPAGNAKHLALLFYLINKLNELKLPFYVKGGIINQYFLDDKARPTIDLDIIIPIDSDTFYQQFEKGLSLDNQLSIKIIQYTKRSADQRYYYDTFDIDLELFYKGELYSKLTIDGISNKDIYNGIDSVIYQGPEIIAQGFAFNGVPIEYVMAEKIVAVTNELVRPYKHLVDLYGLINIDINLELLKKCLNLIEENDNKARVKLNKPIEDYTYQIKADKQFAGGYFFTALQAGYNTPLEEMVDAVNNWLSKNVK